MSQFVARCAEDIIKARGVKPTLSPNLDTLATVEALDVKRLLFIGVGCQVPAHARSLHKTCMHAGRCTVRPSIPSMHACMLTGWHAVGRLLCSRQMRRAGRVC
jgi:hypothetical protein